MNNLIFKIIHKLSKKCAECIIPNPYVNGEFYICVPDLIDGKKHRIIIFDKHCTIHLDEGFHLVFEKTVESEKN